MLCFTLFISMVSGWWVCTHTHVHDYFLCFHILWWVSFVFPNKIQSCALEENRWSYMKQIKQMFRARQTMCKDQIKLKNNTQHCSPVPSMGNTSQILVVNVNMSCPRKREKLARKTVGSINRYFIWISVVWNQLKILIYEWLTNPVGIQN